MSPQTPQVATPDVKEKLTDKMKEIVLKQKEQETRNNAVSARVPYINLVGITIRPEALSLIPEDVALQHKAILFFQRDRDIFMGALDPTDPDVQKLAEKISETQRARVKLHLISEHSFEVAFKLYDILPKLREIETGVKITQEDYNRIEKEVTTFQELERLIKNVTMTDMVTLIIAAAVKSRASDIHIETEEMGIKVRFRIDGLLHDVASIDKKIWPKVIARIKLLSKLKINITTRPQDGRFTIFLTDEKIDVRVSCLPTSYGESVVMRLLMSSAINISLENLGLRGKAFEDVLLEIQKPNGMIVTTGPTGSGKTTTLYAMVSKLNSQGTKIITIEDPIEYHMEGINQSQVNEEKGYTFANGLRSLLRQDPDILMVGEIRDLETADMAINASLTGHLVLSSMHTNDAFGSVPRFLSMNVKPFLLSPSLNAMMGQRLVRRICEYCKQPDTLMPSILQRVIKILQNIPKDSGYTFEKTKLHFAKGGGCDKCQGLGYWGRIGIFEIITMNKEVEELILSGHVSEYDMMKVALKHGTITMIQDGLLKAVDGITTVDEVLRVAKDTTGIN